MKILDRHGRGLDLARHLVVRHGLRAAAVAAERAAQYRAQGQGVAALHWAGIARVVAEMRVETARRPPAEHHFWR